MVKMEVSEPISQSDQSPAATAANPVSPSKSMDTRTLDKARKRQLSDAKVYLLDKKACKQPAPKERKPIQTSNSFAVLDRDALEAGPSSADTPRESQREKRMPSVVAKFQVVTIEEIKMLQDCTKNEIKLEYIRGGLKIRTLGAADHKAVASKLKEMGIEYFT